MCNLLKKKKKAITIWLLKKKSLENKIKFNKILNKFYLVLLEYLLTKSKIIIIIIIITTTTTTGVFY